MRRFWSNQSRNSSGKTSGESTSCGKEEVARLEHCTLRSNEVKKEDFEDWKAHILAEITKKIGGYGRFNNPQDLAMMATRGVNKSPFTEWIVDEPKPKDL